MFRLGLALRGDFERQTNQGREAVSRGWTGGIRAAARGLEKDLEAAFAAGGLGRLGRIWQSDVFPTPPRHSPRAAAIVYPKGKPDQGAYKSAVAFSAGHSTTVRPSQDGGWLAIPTRAALGGARRLGGEPLTPGVFERMRRVRLRYVFVSAELSLLVADNVRQSVSAKGKFRGYRRYTARSSSEREDSVVMFVLKPLATLTARADAEALARKWQAAAPGLIDQAVVIQLKTSLRGR